MISVHLFAAYRNLHELFLCCCFFVALSPFCTLLHEEIVFLFLFVVTTADAVCIVEAIFKRNSLRVIFPSNSGLCVRECMCAFYARLCLYFYGALNC